MVSIIVPVYNVANYLDECLESLLCQTYQNIEILLIDDGSTDSSSEKCDNWALRDKRIKVFHKKNGGLSSARNVGLKFASGNFIGFIDSDDRIGCNMYAEMVNILETNPAVDIITCGIEMFMDGEKKGKAFMGKLHEGIYSFIDYIKYIFQYKIDNAVWNKLYRKECIAEIYFEEGKINEDFLFNMNILRKNGRIYYLPETFYKYRVRKGSITQQANPKLFHFVENAFVIKRQMELFGISVQKEIEAYIYSVMTNYIYTIEKYNSALYYKDNVCFCRNYLFDRFPKCFLNMYWGWKMKIKMILVCIFPDLYRFMLRFK